MQASSAWLYDDDAPFVLPLKPPVRHRLVESRARSGAHTRSDGDATAATCPSCRTGLIILDCMPQC